jgi:hypothetical protein
MPPLSEFDRQATLADDGTLTIGGPMEPSRDKQGAQVARPAPLDVLFVVAQDGGGIARGRGQTENGTWKGTATGSQGLRRGPARAFGLVVEPTITPGNRGVPLVTFHTSTWAQDVELVPPPAGA